MRVPNGRHVAIRKGATGARRCTDTGRGEAQIYLEARALTGLGLLLHRVDLEHFVAETRLGVTVRGAQEEIDDLGFLDRQGVEVDVFDRLDLLVLDETAELGARNPFLFLVTTPAPTATASASATAAVAATAATVAATAGGTSHRRQQTGKVRLGCCARSGCAGRGLRFGPRSSQSQHAEARGAWVLVYDSMRVVVGHTA